MPDTEQIEFVVLDESGDAEDWFTVAYSDTFNSSAVQEQLDLAIARAKEIGGTVERRVTYEQDRTIVWGEDDDDDDDDENEKEDSGIGD